MTVKKIVHVFDSNQSMTTSKKDPLMTVFYIDCESEDTVLRDVNDCIDMHLGYAGFLTFSVHNDNIWNRFVAKLLVLKNQLFDY